MEPARRRSPGVRWLLAALTSGLVVIALLAGRHSIEAVPTSQVEWLEDLDVAMARAREQDKPIFLSFNVRYLANPKAGHC